MKGLLITVAALVTSLIPVAGAQQAHRARVGDRAEQRLAREVRHELVMLPYYGVFDNLYFRVEGENVRLMGQVTRPTLKEGSERVVRDIEGVRNVVNEIEVLPLSPNDDRIRLAAYRAIYGTTGLDRYALQAVPPIHIIVKNGSLSLEGVVANEGDRNMAGMKAQGVPGAFSVKKAPSPWQIDQFGVRHRFCGLGAPAIGNGFRGTQEHSDRCAFLFVGWFVVPGRDSRPWSGGIRKVLIPGLECP